MKCLILIVFALSAASTFSGASERSCIFGAHKSWQNFGQTIEFGRISDDEVAQLDLLTQQQLIAAAQAVPFEEGHVVENALAAIKILRDRSDNGDMYLSHFKLGFKRFTEVVFYPGGQQYGWIFAHGTPTIVGSIADGDVSCQ
jgi:hypothetical protein